MLFFVVSVRVLYDTQARRIRHCREGRNQYEAVTRPKLQHPATRRNTGLSDAAGTTPQ